MGLDRLAKYFDLLQSILSTLIDDNAFGLASISQPLVEFLGPV
jgi:hypothetical protein